MTDPIKFCSILICLIALIGVMPIASASAQGASSSATQSPTTPAAPPGYTKDEEGRIFQTSFDLRRRYHLGVYDMLRIYEDQDFRWDRHSLLVQVGGTHETSSLDGARRHRRRFLEGRLSLAPFEIDALLYGYDFGRSSDQAPLWLTTFIGQPRRFDIPIAIGAGYSMGRLHYRRSDVGDLMLLDMGEVHLNWEFFQGPGLENHLYFTTGIGFGLIHLEGTGRVDLYAAPEVGLRAAWTLTENGLTQLAMEGRMQWAWTMESSRHWQMGSLRASAEWSPLAINDQPLTLFLAPELRYSQIPVAELEGLEVRGILGLRLNLFVPPRSTDVEWR